MSIYKSDANISSVKTMATAPVIYVIFRCSSNEIHTK